MNDRFIEKRYLKIPVKNGNQIRRLTIHKSNVLQMEFLIELPLNGEKEDFFTYIDLQCVLGDSAVFETQVLVDGVYVDDKESLLGNAIFTEVNYTDSVVKRPKLHFTTNYGWNNDPNGMVYDGEKYHLYYQHNPVGKKWNNMSWGHATSKDMIFFKDHGDVMYQDEMGMMFSGSGFYDKLNVSGLGEDNPPILYYYTAAGGANPWSLGHKFTQCLAYSIDNGMTLKKYEMNPIIEHISGNNRDPKIIQYDDFYVIALFIKDNDYMMFRSSDLLNWETSCRITLPGTSECPDFFPLKLNGREYWVFWGANGGYAIGSFDGQHFLPETFGKIHCGTAYAAQTYENQPDSRRIMMHWIRRDMPDELPYNQAMSLPMELSLREEKDIMLCMQPIDEITRLHKNEYTSSVSTLKIGQSETSTVVAETMDVILDIRPTKGFKLNAGRGEFIWNDGILTCGDEKFELPAKDGLLKLRIIVDMGIAEVFGNDGEFYAAMDIDFDGEDLCVLSPIDGDVSIQRFSAYDFIDK